MFFVFETFLWFFTFVKTNRASIIYRLAALVVVDCFKNTLSSIPLLVFQFSKLDKENVSK